MDGPTGLTFGPDGNLYVSSYDGNTVTRYDGKSGEFIDVFAADGLDGPNYLTFAVAEEGATPAADGS